MQVFVLLVRSAAMFAQDLHHLNVLLAYTLTLKMEINVRLVMSLAMVAQELQIINVVVAILDIIYN
jgi:hypothetical protein